jgi:TRAP transporter TAXI family solute receptor
VLYSSPNQIVTLEGAGINKVADLRGKRVSTGAPGSGAEVISFRILEAAGLDMAKDIRRERLSVAESAGALKDRKIDAFIGGFSGIPSSAVLDVATTPGIKMKLIADGELLEKIINKYGPSYFKSVIPKGTYPGMTQSVSVISVATLLVCHEQMEERLAYDIVKTLIEHQEDMKLVHKEVGEQITLEKVVIGSSIPYHAGAIKYYKEKGVSPK